MLHTVRKALQRYVTVILSTVAAIKTFADTATHTKRVKASQHTHVNRHDAQRLVSTQFQIRHDFTAAPSRKIHRRLFLTLAFKLAFCPIYSLLINQTC